MFPWIYEFKWNAGHILFLSAFFTVLGTVFGSVLTAAWRSARDLRLRKDDAIRWESDFEDLPRAARACRHELSGDVRSRTCDHEFDCRTCEAHPEFLARAASAPAARSDVAEAFGFSMPADRLYHRGHAWVRREEDGTYAVGLDDFGARLIGNPDALELPAPGTSLRANGTGWFIMKKGAKLRILAPIDGVVVGQGGKDDPWVLRVRADESENATRHLLTGSEIAPWILREMERLEFSLATGGVGATLADGGELLPEMHTQYPDADWDAVWGQMFLRA
jgi:glycine cleavage system H protein